MHESKLNVWKCLMKNRMWCRRLACLLEAPRWPSGSPRRRSPWLPRARRTVLAAAPRWHHTAPESLKCAWRLHGDHLELRYADTLMRFDFVWLRDHCRSASCYNAKTNQRSLDTASVDLGIKPKAVRVDETTLFLTWPDGHVTRYGLEWLVKNSYEGQKQQVMHPRILWNKKSYGQAQVPSVDCRSFLETDEGLKEFLQNFLLYGIAFVENVAPTKEDTEILAERISLIRETIYGRMWYFTSDFSRGDTAYTKLALDRHTDTTYFQEPCGIQVFHCLKHEGTGGRTLLVDGFYAAEQVLRQAPDQFELLSKVPLKHEYVENVGDCHNHMIGVGPVLNVYPWNNELYLIRYNNYDRAVINTVPYDVVHRWYAAHRTLTAELRRPENELWVKLKPGKALFVDNWRVLHGREAFTGRQSAGRARYRQLCGCYLTRDDVLNAARVLGLQA
ncbi:PREDICTED: LOW QUALITY PROTEIN: trimethyllysine dioxygenase, mitochondrial [Apaloderma vittatum]|uniref:LOW QUALITY PROTEIN: trimethyllysine dioxygenase, mitochondrial n=1 Tax=Apaloderma vittatum TaxID=57397 RepID=UPI0005219EFE|nr:PREDICTED: LOW QUALITY PROTEIN: trimethyllysine dioxygenase, mitochondrial [Apaloderma vittatum]